MRFKKTIASLFIAGSAIGLGAACESVSEDSPKPQGQEQQTPQRGVGSKDASKDVKLGEPRVEYGFITIPATITNHSSKPSDYSIEANVFATDGTQLTTAMGFAFNVAPGGKAQVALDGSLSDASIQEINAQLTMVERVASY